MRDGSGIYTYPPGTPGVAGQTIFSARYNTFLDDLATTLNSKLPINMGGTNATDVTMARANLQAEVALLGQHVTDYNTQVWQTGSFWSGGGAINSPEGAGAAAHSCFGTAWASADGLTVTIEARDINNNVNYYRRKASGSWGAWSADSGSAAFVQKAGDTMTGPLVVLPKGSSLGGAGGNGANTPVTLADANITLYGTGTGTNWAGLGADQDGNFWFRVGLSGTPVPVLSMNSDQTVRVQSAVAASTPTSGALRVTGGAGIGGALHVGAGARVNVGVADKNWWMTNDGSGQPSLAALNDAYSTYQEGRIEASPLKLNLGSGQPVLVGVHSPIAGEMLGATALASAQWVAGFRGVDRGFITLAVNASGYVGYFCQGNAANNVGSITYTTTSVAFNTASDARMKEDLKSFDAGHIIDDTEVYDFKWKDTEERAFGIIAQQAVGVYDAPMHHNEEIDRWFVDYSKYVPVLLQELKALRARVAVLEEKLAPT